jgi:beta-1,4-mannosyltransferase
VPSLTSLPHVRLCYLSEPPSLLRKLPFVLAAPVKILHQVATILYILMFTISSPPEFIMVQVGPPDGVQDKLLTHSKNPPSIPTLGLVSLVGRVRSSKIIIDWHNLGYSILALKLGPSHPFVKIAIWYAPQNLYTPTR